MANIPEPGPTPVETATAEVVSEPEPAPQYDLSETYRRGWEAGAYFEANRSTRYGGMLVATGDFVKNVLFFILAALWIYLIAYLISAGWTDGKER